MYDLRARHWAPCQLLSGIVYRADSRPPHIIARDGFDGTQALNHAFAAFNERTVFASLTLEGVKRFQDVMSKIGVRLPYIYRVHARGLRGYIFRSRHVGPQRLMNTCLLAKICYETYSDEFDNEPENAGLTYQELIKGLTQDLAGRIGRSFVLVNEVHVQGPIPSSRVTLVPHLLNDDIPATSPALRLPRHRRNSI